MNRLILLIALIAIGLNNVKAEEPSKDLPIETTETNQPSKKESSTLTRIKQIKEVLSSSDEWEETDDNANLPLVYGHSLWANIGVAILSAGISSAQNNESRASLLWQMGYTWISKNRIGAGILYTGFHSGGPLLADEPDNSRYFHYVAPQFAMSRRLVSRLSCIWNAGVGVLITAREDRGNESESEIRKTTTTGNVGMNLMGGFQYGFTRHLSATFNGMFLYGVNSGTNVSTSKKIQFGIGMYTLSLGLKYSF